MNVATGSRISVNQLLDAMKRIVGSSVEPIYRESRAGDVKDSQADISKARALLGYEPKVGLDEGLERTLEWCRAESAAPTAR